MKYTTLVIVFILLAGSLSTIAQTNKKEEYNNQELLLYRVSPPLLNKDIPHASEIVGGNPGSYHDIFLTETQTNELKSKGYQLTNLIEQNSPPSLEQVNQYHCFEEIEATLETIHQTYPDITDLFSIGKSYENRDLWCLEISDNPGIDEDEPEILFMGLHHAREWPTIEICLYLAEMLTQSYETNSTIQHLIENRRLWIIPCVNPDGYVYDHDVNQGNQWWRKNRHYLESYDIYGIDLNRNYAGSTNGDAQGMWGSQGMSHHPTSELYCGNRPFSEKETQAIKDFFIAHDICASISWHTYSELVMWSWGYSTEMKTPHNDYLSRVGIEMASRITRQNGSGTYTPTQSAGLYPTTGDTIDWMYGYSHYVKGKPCFGYTIEACTSFHPDAESLNQICKENYDGALYLLEESASIDILTPVVLPPIIDDITDIDDGQSTILWHVPNPLSQPQTYELKEYKTLQISTEDCESLKETVILDGFIQSSERSQSGEYSFFAHKENNKVSALTTRYPLYINSSMDLSFACWYDIEEDWDKAMIEISDNGRSYEVIDTFTGSSNGWIQRQYSLDAYIGQSIYIRFRYSTDDFTCGEGFFIDDISPVASYNEIITVNAMITAESYTISFDDDTDYYYQVRGYNDVFGYGDYSMLYPTQTVSNDNHVPENLTITGPTTAKPGQTISFTIQAADPDGDSLFYYINWGDGTKEEWIGPYGSDEMITINHTWQQKGEYQIELRVKDILNAKSAWTTHHLTLPKHKTINSLWKTICSFFPLLYYLLDPMIYY